MSRPSRGLCRGAAGKRCELGDDGERERSKRVERREIPPDAVGEAVLGLLHVRLEVVAELRVQAEEPLLPALLAADDCGVDEQPLPVPRGAKGSEGRRTILLGHGANGAGVLACVRVFLGAPAIVERRRGLSEERAERLLVGRRDAIAGGRSLRRSAVGVLVGHLAEREVLGEASRREAVGGAAEEREHRASRGIGLARSTGKIGGNVRASQRLLEVRGIGGRAEQYGDAIEPRAARRFGEHEPGDLDALATLTGRGEDLDLTAVGDRQRRLADLCARVAEEPAVEARERRGRGLRSRRAMLDLRAVHRRLRERERAVVAGRERREDGRRAGNGQRR
jgi:hypothetical protein